MSDVVGLEQTVVKKVSKVSRVSRVAKKATVVQGKEFVCRFRVNKKYKSDKSYLAFIKKINKSYISLSDRLNVVINALFLNIKMDESKEFVEVFDYNKVIIKQILNFIRKELVSFKVDYACYTRDVFSQLEPLEQSVITSLGLKNNYFLSEIKYIVYFNFYKWDQLKSTIESLFLILKKYGVLKKNNATRLLWLSDFTKQTVAFLRLDIEASTEASTSTGVEVADIGVISGLDK